MKPYNNIAGVVLAGGKSTRFGSDKALQHIDGVPMAARAADLLSSICGAGVMISGTPSLYDQLGYTTVPDRKKELGPIGGIVSTLGLDVAPYTLYLPCDMPGVTPELLARLPEAIGDAEGAYFVSETGRMFPLPALLRHSAIAAAWRIAINDTRPMRDLLESLESVVAVQISEEEARKLANCNTVDELDCVLGYTR